MGQADTQAALDWPAGGSAATATRIESASSRRKGQRQCVRGAIQHRLNGPFSADMPPSRVTQGAWAIHVQVPFLRDLATAFSKSMDLIRWKRSLRLTARLPS